MKERCAIKERKENMTYLVLFLVIRPYFPFWIVPIFPAVSFVPLFCDVLNDLCL